MEVQLTPGTIDPHKIFETYKKILVRFAIVTNIN